MREGPNTALRGLTPWTPETQDLDSIDLKVVLPNVNVGVAMATCHPNVTTLHMHSTTGIDSPAIEIQTADTE